MSKNKKNLVIAYTKDIMFAVLFSLLEDVNVITKYKFQLTLQVKHPDFSHKKALQYSKLV